MKSRDRLEQLHKLASLRETHARNRQKFVDQRSKVRELEIGQRVLILLPTSNNKLLAEWNDPYNVLEKVKAKSMQRSGNEVIRSQIQP